MPIFCYPSSSKGTAVSAEELSATLSPDVVWINLLSATQAEVAATESEYPYAIFVMACSVALPFWFCLRKGWL